MAKKKTDWFAYLVWTLLLFSVPIVLQNLYIFTTWDPQTIYKVIFTGIGVFFWIMQRIGILLFAVGILSFIFNAIKMLNQKPFCLGNGIAMVVFGTLLFLMKLFFMKSGIMIG